MTSGNQDLPAEPAEEAYTTELDRAREAVRAAPESFAAHEALIVLLMDDDSDPGLAHHVRFAEAEEVARRCIELDYRSPLGYAALANVYTETNRHVHAVSQLETAITLAPESLVLQRQLAEVRVMLGQGKLTQVIGPYADQLKADPDNREVRLHLTATVHKLLRRMRWIALICLFIASNASGLLTSEDADSVREMPMSPDGRIAAGVVIVVLIAVLALVTHRRTQGAIWWGSATVLRSSVLANAAVVPAIWAVLCCYVLLVPAWESRTEMYWVLHAAWIPILATMAFDQVYMRTRPPSRWYAHLRD